MNNNLLQELAKIGDVNQYRLIIHVAEIPDKDFTNIYGEEAFARIDITLPESINKLFGGKTKTET